MYGDEHIQENLHAAQTLKLLENPDCDFLSGKFSRGDVKTIKKRIAQSIIFTDIATMKKLREEFQTHLDLNAIVDGANQAKIIDNSSPLATEKTKQLVCSTVLHACDISTNLREFQTSLTWTDLLFQEFFHQGDMEKQQGLEVSMMCDRETTKIASGQAGFIQFVILPIFKQMAQVVPNIAKVQIASGNRNIDLWKARAEFLDARSIKKLQAESSDKKEATKPLALKQKGEPLASVEESQEDLKQSV